jgi:Family of unknown function (DUF6194)
VPTATTIQPDEILGDLLKLDPGLTPQRYWGEHSIFYNPAGARPLGTIFASIKDHDGANDRSANLSRPSVYRFAFCLAPERYERAFGAPPGRPPKGGVVALPDYDPTRLGELMPHPVYAWMRWVQILSPSRRQFHSLRPLLDDSLELVRAKWRQKQAA